MQAVGSHNYWQMGDQASMPRAGRGANHGIHLQKSRGE